MKLNFETIRSITSGAVRITQEQDGIHFFRFTQEQEDLYRSYNANFYRNSFSTSGVKLRFRTDSAHLTLGATAMGTGSRSYYSFDVVVNGRLVDSMNNFDRIRLPEKYIKVKLPQLPEEKTFDLGAGEKEVCLYLPWSCKVALWNLSLDDGAKVIPIKQEKTLLCFGDSITHGYDALHPCCKYTSLLAEDLGCEEYNKGIGGEIFMPALAKTREPFRPDLITVAYGTNDWKKVSLKTFRKNCYDFYRNLSQNYPDSKIFALTPIWRKIWDTPTELGEFELIEKTIRQVAENFENITVIRGFDFVPHDKVYFADLTLHPNSEGFRHYYKNLKKAIEENLK